jgi:HSP20 family protein
MSLIRRNSYLPTSSFFDDNFTKDLFNWSDWSSEGGSMPKVNIVESNDNFRVEMAAPGMKKDDFNVELDNDMLTISSEVTHESDYNNDQRYNRKEFSYQSFKRSFYLPNTVEADKIEARYHNGLLTLVIPKKEEARKKPVKTIAIH